MPNGNGKKPRLNKETRLTMQAAAVRRTDARTPEEIMERYLSLPPAQSEKEFLDAASAAALFRLSPGTIQRWIKDGYICGLSIGKKYLVEVASLKAYCAERAKARMDF